MIRAILCDVLARFRAAEFGPTGLADFTLGPGQEVDAAILLDDPAWTLYSIDLDLDGEQAIFTLLAPGTDLSTAAFAHILQHEAARQVLTLPLAALPGLSRALPSPEKVIFLFSMGRCGTTLASHIMAQVPGVFSLSEPGPFMALALARFQLPLALQQDLVVALTRFCYRPPAGRGTTTLALKFQSQVLFQAELFHRAFPNAINIFQYRDAASWGNSFTHFMQMVGVPLAMDSDTLAFSWKMISGAAPLDLLSATTDLTAQSFAHVEVLAPGWALHVQEFLRLAALGLPFLALRYNELNSDRAGSTARLLAYCGLPPSAQTAAITAFDHDSQEGTQISRDHKSVDFTAGDYTRLRQILAQLPDNFSPNIILPNAPS